MKALIKGERVVWGRMEAEGGEVELFLDYELHGGGDVDDRFWTAPGSCALWFLVSLEV